MARFSADIKERFFGSVKSFSSTVQNLTSFRSPAAAALPNSEETVATVETVVRIIDTTTVQSCFITKF